MLRPTRLFHFSGWALFVVGLTIGSGAHGALAQTPNSIANDDMTLVMGTRFVVAQPQERSAKSLFYKSRIPLKAFNETDHCIDQGALEVAKEYFTDLGQTTLQKAAYFYFVPDAEITKLKTMCVRLHKETPKAWTKTTKIIAFGKVVPSADAPALERTLR